MELLSAFVGVPEVNRVYNVDALTLLRAMPSASVGLIAVDPPYNGVKDEAWDNQWATDADFLEWLRAHLIEFRRVLKPNGSLYLFASPRMAARVEVLTGEYFNVLNQVVWYKTNGNRNWSADKETVRGFLPNTERIIFAEQFGSDEHAIGDIGEHYFQPIQQYLVESREQSNLSNEAISRLSGISQSQIDHYFRRDANGWRCPDSSAITALSQCLPITKTANDLQIWRDELRTEYEELRRPFNVSVEVEFTDVWNFATVSQYPGKHPCEKPAAMMQHIINASSRPGDLVLDCFAGSGATLAAAFQLGRQYIGCDIGLNWVEVARNKCVKDFGAKRRSAVTTLDDLPLFAQVPA